MSRSAPPPPLREQELLLQATFGPGPDWHDAWSRWRALVDLDAHVDLGSFRLLPLLARRLRERGVDDPWLDRFAGIARKHWLANQVFLRDYGHLVTRLRAGGIAVMVPAEVAMSLRYYPDRPLDPQREPALVVPPHQSTAAFGVLEAAGWRPSPPVHAALLGRYTAARSSHPFRGPADRSLTLQWQVLSPPASPELDADVWARTVPVTIGDGTAVTGSPTDLLIQLCTQRVWHRPTPLFTRAVDVMMLLTAAPDAIAWDDVAARAVTPGLTLPIRETLFFLRDRLDQQLPAGALARIGRHAVPRLDRVEYERAGRPSSWLGDALRLWLGYRRTVPANRWVSVVRFPRFLQHYLKLPHLWQMPLRVLSRTIQRLREPSPPVTAYRPTEHVPTPGR